MSEISKPFPSAPAATSPSRDPRRSSRLANPTHVPLATNALPAPAPAKPRSYGEELIESLAALSTEVATVTSLKNEYTKAIKAQLGVNQQYDKVKNLSQFPAAQDLLNRIRATQNKDVDSLRDKLTAHKEDQKTKSKKAAEIVDQEAKSKAAAEPVDNQIKGFGHLSDTVRSIEVETKSNKVSIQAIREDFAKLKKETSLASERYTDLQKFSKSNSDELNSLRRAQDTDYQLLKRNRDRVDTLSDEVRKQADDNKTLSADYKRLSRLGDDAYDLKRSLERVEAKVEQSLRQKKDSQMPPTDANQNNLKTLEDRLVGLEKRQSSSPVPEYDILTKRVNDTFSRLGKVEMGHQNLTNFVNELSRIHQMKDELLSQTIDENQQKIKQELEETVVKIKAGAASDLERAMVQVKTEGVPSETGGMISLRESAEIHDQRLQTVETAVTSLEARYSSLAPDSLALQVLPMVQRQYPPAPALQAVVERFHGIQMHLAQVSHIPSLSAAIENQSQQLAALAALASHIPRGDDEARASATVVNMQSSFSQLERRLSELQKTLADHMNNLQSQSRNQNTAVAEPTENQPPSTPRVDRINELKSQLLAQSTAIAQLKESLARQTQSVEEKLTDRVKEVENKVQGLDQKVSDNLGENGLNDVRLGLENLEVAIQQHVDNFTHQITQLEDSQKNSTLDIGLISDRQKSCDETANTALATVEDMTKTVQHLEEQQNPNDFQTEIEGIMAEVKELTIKLQEIEHAKALLDRKFGGSQSPRPERSPSPVPTNRSEALRVEEEIQSNPTDITSAGSKSSKKQKNKKRKFSHVFVTSPHSSAPSSLNSTPQSTPGAEGPSKQSFKKKQKQRTLINVTNSLNGTSSNK
jgi:DNA repair exonuclease SbcCD ATPase subunit